MSGWKRTIERRPADDVDRRRRRERPLAIDDGLQHVIDAERRQQQRQRHADDATHMHSAGEHQTRADRQPHKTATADDADSPHQWIQRLNSMRHDPQEKETIECHEARGHCRTLTHPSN